MWREPSIRRRLSIVALAALALTGCGYGSVGGSACADAVIDDWTRGALGTSYSPECYEAAIDALPEDLRAYTTAADDIARVGIAANRAADEIVAGADASPRRLSSQEADATETETLRAFPTEVAALGAFLAVLVTCGAAASLIRRRRGR